MYIYLNSLNLGGRWGGGGEAFPCQLSTWDWYWENPNLAPGNRAPHSPHCNEKIPIFRDKYSQKGNIGVSVPISTFMCQWLIYIFRRSVCLFCWRKYVDRSWDYINRSQTNECENWGWGRAISRKGIQKWDFRCSAGDGRGIVTKKYYNWRVFYCWHPPDFLYSIRGICSDKLRIFSLGT